MATIARANPTTIYNASEGRKFAADTTLVVVSCCVCGVTYAIPKSFDDSALKYRGDQPNGWSICCPFGHTWHYVGQTDEERLRAQLRESRARSGRLAADLDQTKASLRGTRANAARTRKELSRTKERVAAGVCPCCNRTFKQLARHMATRHPNYVAKETA